MKGAVEFWQGVQALALVAIAVWMAGIMSRASSIDVSLRRIAAQGPVKVETPIQRIEAQGLPALNGMGCSDE